ncbi:hypothetical protein [Streptomyces sp. NPDC004135]
MGDRLSRDADPGRRRVRTGEAVPGPWDPLQDMLHTTLVAALLAGGPGPEAERRAVAAFRTARDAGAHRARTRRRDDWQPSARPRTGRPAKATAAAVFTSLALGGVAVAAIGSAGSSANGTGGQNHPSPSATSRPADQAPPSPSGAPEHRRGPSPAQDVEAHCRAYERAGERGRTPDATAWRRLVAAAGGADEVDAYCAQLEDGTTAAPGGPGGGAADAGPGPAGKGDGTPGDGNPGQDAPGGGKPE